MRALDLRIGRVVGGTGPVGIAEVEVATPDGQLDLREFVRTPGDLASRAGSDEQLGAALAARPPRYELRRLVGLGIEDEETELRREIATFGDHRYELRVRARADNRTADTAIDALLGGAVGAAGTSRFGGDLGGRGRLVTDDKPWTGWEPVPREGERVDVRFPATEIRKVEVLVVSGRPRGAARSRVTGVEVSVGNGDKQVAESTLRRDPRCTRPEPSARGCLETHVVRVPPTEADALSVTLTGLQPVVGRLGAFPPSVVEVRVNGRDWSQFGDVRPRKACAPLVGVDGRAIGVRLRSSLAEVLEGAELELEACEPIRLRAGLHRIETLPGLSGAVLTVSLVPRGEGDVPRWGDRESGERGSVELVDRSSTRTRLDVDAPEGAVLIGGMPWHEGWTADRDELVPYPVPLDTFAAWTVKAPTAGPLTLEFGPQRIYELALAVGVAAAAWCLWRVTRRRGAGRAVTIGRPAARARRARRRPSHPAVLGLAVAVAGFVIAGAMGAAVGALGGMAAARRSRVVLIAAASALFAAAAFTVLEQPLNEARVPVFTSAIRWPTSPPRSPRCSFSPGSPASSPPTTATPDALPTKARPPRPPQPRPQRRPAQPPARRARRSPPLSPALCSARWSSGRSGINGG